MLVCFRRLKDDPVTVNWKTAIFVINADGTGFHTLSDGTHTDFKEPGHTLYVADCDAEKRAITNVKVIASADGRPAPFFAKWPNHRSWSLTSNAPLWARSPSRRHHSRMRPGPSGSWGQGDFAPGSDRPVPIGGDPRLVFRGSTGRSRTVRFGFSTQKMRGVFAGNFEMDVRPDSLGRAGETWEVSLPLSGFRPLQPQLSFSPEGLELTDV